MTTDTSTTITASPVADAKPETEMITIPRKLFEQLITVCIGGANFGREAWDVYERTKKFDSRSPISWPSNWPHSR